jgi:DNA-binding NtrC family response regulator
VPPLRARGEDVLLLARHFLSRRAEGAAPLRLTHEAEEALLAHGWPGNVRELENRVHRAALLASPPFAARADLGLGPAGEAPDREPEQPSLHAARTAASRRFERLYLEETLRRTGGNVSRAATLAGISRQVFHRLLRRHAIDRRFFRPQP